MFAIIVPMSYLLLDLEEDKSLFSIIYRESS